MKASEVLNRYAAGERNFQCLNLRGQSFEGKDLAGADFSKADLRSANFTGANLRGANFTGAKCGLQRRWATLLIILSSLLAGISGFLSIVIGFIVVEIFYPSSSGFQIAGWISLIILAIFLVLSTRKGIIAGAGAVALILVVALVGIVGVFIASGGPVRNEIANLVGAVLVAVAITGAGVVAVALTGVVAGAVSIAVAVIGAGIGVLAAVVLGVVGAEKGVVTGVAVGAVTVAVIVAMAVAGVYIGWRAMRGDEKDAWVRDFALAFAAIGGTSFKNAKLIDADFTRASLKSTDFREANLTRTCWRDAQKLDRVRPGRTYLKNALLRELLTTGIGQNQNFDYQDLRDTNLSGANLENASLIDTDFYQANLQGANLSRAILVRSNFERADLRNANLTGSCIQDFVITESTKLDGIICDYVYLKWVNGDKRDQMPPRGKFKAGGFVAFVRYILETVELFHEKDINPRLALTVLQKMSRDYDEPFDIVALGKKGERVFIQVKVSENVIREDFKDDYYSRYDNDLKLWSGNIERLPPAVNSFIEKRISEIALERTDDLVFVDATYVAGNYTEIRGEVNMSGDRNIHIESGNYNERIEGDYIQQQGSFGVGVNKGEIKAEKIAGTINESRFEIQHEIQQMIESLRQQIEALDNQAVRTEALDYLKDVETEAQSALPKPKSSRLKSSLMTLLNVVKDTALVANAVTALAERLGIQLPHVP
jgi:uncharacterized protein YjbI with pentapeptide repeats